MPISNILETAQTAVDATAEAASLDLVQDRLTKIQTALAQYTAKYELYTKKLENFKAEIAAATTATQVQKICGKSDFTVKFLHD